MPSRKVLRASSGKFMSTERVPIERIKKHIRDIEDGVNECSIEWASKEFNWALESIYNAYENGHINANEYNMYLEKATKAIEEAKKKCICRRL